MSEKSRNWINRHESWWNESINKEVAFHDLERILDDYERELRLSNVVVPNGKFYCHDKTGGDCNSLNIKQCKECFEIENRQKIHYNGCKYETLQHESKLNVTKFKIKRNV